MGLKKLFEVLKKNKEHRKDYSIKWRVRVTVDTDSYMCSVIPTVIFIPWVYRRHGESIIEILWLNIGIGFGEWRSKEI